MAKNNLNREAYDLAQEWVRWLDTRRFYGPPQQRSILAMMIKDDDKCTSCEPDADNSMELHAFNLAVCGLEIGQFVPFVVVYCDFRPGKRPVKCISADMGIDRSTFYDRADKAASSVLKTTRQLVEMSCMVRREAYGIV